MQSREGPQSSVHREIEDILLLSRGDGDDPEIPCSRDMRTPVSKLMGIIEGLTVYLRKRAIIKYR